MQLHEVCNYSSTEQLLVLKKINLGNVTFIYLYIFVTK